MVPREDEFPTNEQMHSMTGHQLLHHRLKEIVYTHAIGNHNELTGI